MRAKKLTSGLAAIIMAISGCVIVFGMVIVPNPTGETDWLRTIMGFSLITIGIIAFILATKKAEN